MLMDNALAMGLVTAIFAGTFSLYLIAKDAGDEMAEVQNKVIEQIVTPSNPAVDASRLVSVVRELEIATENMVLMLQKIEHGTITEDELAELESAYIDELRPLICTP
jgi:predicted transcriptional regulator